MADPAAGLTADDQTGEVDVQAIVAKVLAQVETRLAELQQVARERKNTFEALMEAGKTCSLGSMSHALYDVGGEYRRNM